MLEFGKTSKLYKIEVLAVFVIENFKDGIVSFKTVPNYIKLPTVIVTVECLDLFLITIFGFVNFNFHL